MCGIAGYINMDTGADRDLLISMTNNVRHRGPDGEGYALIGKDGLAHYHGADSHQSIKDSTPPIESAENGSAQIGFGHRRLSIIDISSAGHQPMEKNGNVIVYNGMIYNYIELKDELCDLGHTFTGNCDTEVILAAYNQWGTDCINRFNGMWAFAIYDSKARTIFLSRDRYGVKPLYYYSNGNKFLFSSEIKQILADDTIPRLVNAEIMSSYLLFNSYEYDKQTFFKDIYQIKGGYNATLRLDFDSKKITDFKVWQYYSVNNLEEDKMDGTPRDVIGNQLTQAVKRRLRSDVKLGSCLSGGLDSSSIVALACRELKNQNDNPANFETVTTAFPDSPEVNETEYSRAVAEHCGCKENYVYTDVSDVQRDLAKVTWHHDEPSFDFLEHQWRVFEKASQLGCKVLLDGQGGDEVLSGYKKYYGVHLYKVLKTQGIARYIRELGQCVKNSGISYAFAFARTFSFNIKTIRLFRLRRKNKRFLKTYVMQNRNEKAIEHLFCAGSGTGLNKLDITSISLPSIIHEVDRNSMAHGLEVRLPFLDYQLVEAAVPIPLSEKIKEGYTKFPLREFISGKIPREVVWRRRKLGFAIPIKKWTYELDRAYVLDLLDNAKSRDLFQIDKLRRDYLKKRVNIEMFVKFIIVEVWMRVFDVKIQAAG